MKDTITFKLLIEDGEVIQESADGDYDIFELFNDEEIIELTGMEDSEWEVKVVLSYTPATMWEPEESDCYIKDARKIA